MYLHKTRSTWHLEEQRVEDFMMTYLPKTIVEIMHVVHANSLVDWLSVNQRNASSYSIYQSQREQTIESVVTYKSLMHLFYFIDIGKYKTIARSKSLHHSPRAQFTTHKIEILSLNKLENNSHVFCWHFCKANSKGMLLSFSHYSLEVFSLTN